MTDDIAFPALETDAAAIAAFSKRHISRTEAALCDAQFETDAAQFAKILEDPDNLGGIIRRGNWIFNWHRNANHPRGIWRRVKDGTAITADAPWQTVFDLDAFCEMDGDDWHWRGAATLWSDPGRVVLHLSHKGSDLTRHLEWDCDTAAAVSGGFDIPPARSDANWLDENTLLFATAALPGSATRSGWQGRVVKLRRGTDLTDAPTVFEVDHDDLLGYGYTFPLRDGSRGIGFGRVRNIGDTVQRLQIGDTDHPLDAPSHTSCTHNDTHYAYVTADDGPDAPGTLVLRRIDGSDKKILFTPSERRAVQDAYAVFGRDHLFWVEEDTLTPQLRRYDLRDPDASPETLPLPIDTQSVGIGRFDAEGPSDGPMQLFTSGFLEPNQTWVFDQTSTPAAAERLIKGTTSFDATGMEVRMHMAISDDGTKVPYHIILPKDHASQMGRIPVLQYGYGGFGVSLGPYYMRLQGPAWLSRGGAYVQGYIRGGGEFGTAWHLAAKGEKRKLAFADFAAIARDLVQRGYTTADQIACHGGSNGGLLCGVMLTRYPEHFGAVWATVGVYDQLRYHLFPAGAGWIDEYGDPDDPQARDWLRAYSPVHNVVAQDDRAYPPALIDTNETDDRVDPSHSRRFAALLEQAGQPVRFHSRAGGHGGGGQTTEAARELALGYAFLRHALSL